MPTATCISQRVMYCALEMILLDIAERRERIEKETERERGRKKIGHLTFRIIFA